MTFEMNSNQEEISSRKEIMEDKINDFLEKSQNKFNGKNLEKVSEALDFMLKIHLPQADRVDGLPFATHPLAVAEKVMGLSDNHELTIAALIHDSVEDQPDHIFVERINRKYPNRDFNYLRVDAATKERYKDTLKTWSFKEIRERFGEKVSYYVENMTNHDFNSLAEDIGLEGDGKQDFINKMYAEHVEDIINDPELFTLKLADLSTNIDLHSLDPAGEKYQKLKRKYKSVIEAVLKKLINLEEDHPIYAKREEVINDLEQIYKEQYN